MPKTSQRSYAAQLRRAQEQVAEYRAQGYYARVIDSDEPGVFFTKRDLREWMRETYDDAQRILNQTPRPVPALVRLPGPVPA